MKNPQVPAVPTQKGSSQALPVIVGPIKVGKTMMNLVGATSLEQLRSEGFVNTARVLEGKGWIGQATLQAVDKPDCVGNANVDRDGFLGPVLVFGFGGVDTPGKSVEWLASLDANARKAVVQALGAPKAGDPNGGDSGDVKALGALAALHGPGMKSWIVEFEVRQQGAIGVFEKGTWPAEAPSSEEANDMVMRSLWAKGLETRGSQTRLIEEGD